MAQPDQANALPQRLPLRLIVPAGAAVLAVLLVAALVVPSLVGGGPAGTVGPLPGGSAAPAGSTTTSTTAVVTCSTWSRNWRDHCESLQLAAPATRPTTSSPPGGGATTTTVGTTLPPPPGQGPTAPTGATTPSTPSIPTSPGSPSLSDDWTAVATKAAPAVLLVEAVGVATGTGFQVDGKGHVVTNRHVVAGASRFRVHTTGGRTLSAKLLGKSATHDIAVLQVKGLNARPLAWLAGKPKMGLGVLVLGFPGGPHAGHPLTATLGIVSGTGRNVGSGYKDMVQFDAAINHGNSGGPVLDSSGRVVAVATASASVPDPSDPPQSINYGVLGANAKSVVKRFVP